jgi:hypothetical protein
MEASNEFVADFGDVDPFTGEQETQMMITSPVPSAPLMRSQTQYHTAIQVQKPRDLDKVVAAVLREAEFAGDAFYYSWPVNGGKKKVEGGSIGLAMAVAREWGNCAVPVEYYETPLEWIFTAHFVDLERGFTVSRVFRKKKGRGSIGGKYSNERAEDMTFQAAQSRAIRNVVLAGVPRWLTEQAKDRAKDAVLKGISREGIAVAIEKALKFLAGWGVTEPQVVQAIGKKRSEWGTEDIANLRGMASQLKDGQATAESLFPPVETGKPSEEKESEKKPRKTRSDAGKPRKPPEPTSPEPQEAPENSKPDPWPLQNGNAASASGTQGEDNGNPGNPTPDPATEKQVGWIRDLAAVKGKTESQICQEYDLHGLVDDEGNVLVDKEQAANILASLRSLPNKA